MPAASCATIRRAAAKAATATTATLAERRRADGRNDNARPEHLHEAATVERKIEPHRFEKFVVVDVIEIADFGTQRAPGIVDCQRAPRHDWLPSRFAARSTARMIRRCVPQRKMLRSMAARISPAVGCGLSRSSATALMIMPGVQ